MVPRPAQDLDVASRECYPPLKAKLRPEAVALVDGFKFDDIELMQTAIGAEHRLELNCSARAH